MEAVVKNIDGAIAGARAAVAARMSSVSSETVTYSARTVRRHTVVIAHETFLAFIASEVGELPPGEIACVATSCSEGVHVVFREEFDA